MRSRTFAQGGSVAAAGGAGAAHGFHGFWCYGTPAGGDFLCMFAGGDVQVIRDADQGTGMHRTVMPGMPRTVLPGCVVVHYEPPPDTLWGYYTHNRFFCKRVDETQWVMTGLDPTKRACIVSKPALVRHVAAALADAAPARVLVCCC